MGPPKEGALRIFFKIRRINYPNLFCYKTLNVSGILYAHHQEFSTVHSALVRFILKFSQVGKIEYKHM